MEKLTGITRHDTSHKLGQLVQPGCRAISRNVTKRLNSVNELELTQHVRVVSILIINQQQIKANITIVTNQPEFSATNLSSLNACV